MLLINTKLKYVTKILSIKKYLNLYFIMRKKLCYNLFKNDKKNAHWTFYNNCKNFLNNYIM